MSSENTKKSRAGRSLAIALTMLAVLFAPIVVFQSKLRTIGDLYAESGFAGVYYRAKDLWPWASPNVHWDAADPASHGVDSTKLKGLWQRMDSANTQAFLVAINNQIVFEQYGSGGGVNRRISTAAMGKAITAGLVLLVAMDDELVALDDFMHEYVSSWKSHDDKQKITIRHLVTHESGFDNPGCRVLLLEHGALRSV